MVFDLLEFFIGVLDDGFEKFDEFLFGGRIIKDFVLFVLELTFHIEFGVVVELFFELGDDFVFGVHFVEKVFDLVDFFQLFLEHLKTGWK